MMSARKNEQETWLQSISFWHKAKLNFPSFMVLYFVPGWRTFPLIDAFFFILGYLRRFYETLFEMKIPSKQNYDNVKKFLQNRLYFCRFKSPVMFQGHTNVTIEFQFTQNIFSEIDTRGFIIMSAFIYRDIWHWHIYLRFSPSSNDTGRNFFY